MQRRRAVKHDRVTVDNLAQTLPDLVGLLFDHLLRRLDGRRVTFIFQFRDQVRFEEFERHLFRQTALVHFQARPDDDDGTAGEVDAFSEQVLTETSLLTLDDLGKRLQRALVRPFDRVRAAAVVEERIDRLLQHPLFVADDDLRRFQFDQALQALVAVDDAAVQVVDVGNGELAAVQADQRTQVRRQDRQDGEHHPCRVVAGVQERLDDLQALDDRFAFRFGLGRFHLLFEDGEEFDQVEFVEHVADDLAAHLCFEAAFGVALVQSPVLLFVQDVILCDGRCLLGVIMCLAAVFDDIRLVVEYALEVFHLDAQQRTDTARQRVHVPDVRDRRDQVDVAHAGTAYFRRRDFDAALFTDDTLVAHLLIFAAETFVVADRAEDLRAEQPVALRFQRPVVDRLGLFDFAVAPGEDLLRARQAKLQLFDVFGAIFFRYFNRH